MKTKVTIKRSMLACLLMMLVASFGVNAQTVVNSDWDFSGVTLGATTGIEGWWIFGSDNADHEFIADPDDASNILLQTTLTDTAGINPWTVQVASVDTELEPNSTYVISGRIKFVSADAENGALNFVSGDVGLNQYGAAINHDEWTVFKFDTVKTDTAVTANVGFHLADPAVGVGDVFHIDYIKVEKIEETVIEEPSGIVNTTWNFDGVTLGATTGIEGWWILGSDNADHEFIADPDDATNTLLETTLTDTAGINPWTVQVASVGTELEPNSTYVISGRIKFVSADAENGALNFVSGPVGLNQYGAAINHDEWTVFKFDTVKTDTAVIADVGFHLADPAVGVGDKFHIDYIKVEKIEEEVVIEGPETPEDFVNLNGDFSDSELGPTTGTDGWFFNGADALADFSIVEDPDNAPYKLLKVKVTDIDGADNPWNIQAGSANISFEARSQYVISARMQYNSATGATTGSMSLDPGPAAGVAQYGVSIPEGEWTIVTLDTVTTDTAFTTNVGLHMGFNTHANGDSTYIDYVKVERIGDAPLAIPAPPYDFGDVLTYNGSFTEQDLGDASALAWTITLAENSPVEIVDDAQDGDSRALKFEVSWNGVTEWYNTEAVNEPVNVVEGETYEVSAWLKADNSDRQARVYLGMPQSGGWERARGGDTPVTNLTTEWQEVTFSHQATASNETNSMRVGVEVNAEVNDGGTIWLDNVTVTKVMGTNSEDNSKPLKFSLEQNYPNPFNPSTRINYSIPNTAHVTLDVFNMLGQKVATLVDTRQQAGNLSVTFDARNLASGIYIYRIQAGSFVQTKRMTLIK